MRLTTIFLMLIVVLFSAVACAPKTINDSIEEVDIESDSDLDVNEDEFGDDLDAMAEDDVSDSEIKSIESELNEIDSIESDLEFEDMSEEDFEMG